jgi:hypothetical protein
MSSGLRAARGLLVASLLVLASIGESAGQAPGSADAGPGSAPAVTPPDAAGRAVGLEFLPRLPYAWPEPRLDWDWEPTAFEPLANPMPDEYRWRLAELRKPELPKVARARLNLELAFLDAAAPNGPVELRGGGPDSLGAERRALEAQRLYRELLVEAPGGAVARGEFLTDLGDLFRFFGEPDSALFLYREASALARPPARVFVRAANAELESLAERPDSARAVRFREALRRGQRFFAATPPADTLKLSRFHLERGRYRIDRAILESRADRLLHPGRWETAGVDSLFTLLARVVAPETRRAFQAAAEYDTNLAEAHGLLGSLVTGQILLPLAAEGILLRERTAARDSLAAGLARSLVSRELGRGDDARYAAANLNRCELLEPGRFPRARADLARLALLMSDPDGSAGLWSSLLEREPWKAEDHVQSLVTALATAPHLGAPASTLPEARRVETAVLGAFDRRGSAPLLALLAASRARLARYDEADRDFQRVVLQDSTVSRARLGLAVSYLRDLDALAAEPHLRFVGKVFGELDDVSRGVYCAGVGLLYALRNEPGPAGRWLDEAIRFDPMEPLYREARGRLPRGAP